MMKLSDFITLHNINLLQKNDIELKKIITKWVQSIEEQNYSFELHPEYLEMFSITVTDLELPEKLKAKAEVDKFILSYDALYEYHVRILQNQFKLESRTSPVNHHALNEVECDQASGVKAQLYYVAAPDKRKAISSVAMSGLGTPDDERIQTSKFISDGFSKLEFNPKCRDHLRNHLRDNHHYHAEELLFVSNYEKIIGGLIELKKKKLIQSLDEKTKQAFDFQWMQHLNTYPRLEFNISTSPCEDCRELFKSFRANLNAHGIHIPIIILKKSVEICHNSRTY